MLILSKGLSWPFFPHNDSFRTGIYAFDFKKPSDDLKELPIDGNFNQEDVVSFHGLSVWQDKSGGMCMCAVVVVVSYTKLLYYNSFAI